MKKSIILTISFLLFSIVSYASTATEEINFLLSFMEESDCIFVRNGKEYPGKEASAHLSKKYNYAKSRIKSSEDFIARIASQSSISKKPYSVRCKDSSQSTKEWLTNSLMNHRKTIKK